MIIGIRQRTGICIGTSPVEVHRNNTPTYLNF
ncbi:hypothetical protein GGR26_002563 [Lewinella marina]|nr:hypothetical protein [Neolewinella marina]